jgi:hypothetical protein
VDTIRDRDREYLESFPITEPLVSIHGPFTPVANWDPERGWYDPDPEGDYESWHATTISGRALRIPLTVVKMASTAGGGRYLWEVDYRGTADVAERQRMWARELERVRIRLNEAAKELVGGDRNDRC